MSWEAAAGFSGAAIVLLVAIFESARRTRAALLLQIEQLRFELAALSRQVATSAEQAAHRGERLTRLEARADAIEARQHRLEIEFVRCQATHLGPPIQGSER